MSESRIIRIPILPLGMVNAHLIVGPSGCVLVDAGLPGSEHKVERALARVGRGWNDLRLIVITHAHVDHAGAAVALRRSSGAPVVAHAAELAHLTGHAPMTFCPTGWFGRLFVRAPLIHTRYDRLEPDLLLSGDETLDLARFGVAGVVRHSGGHTEGSLSVQLTSNDALVGDLLASGVLIGGLIRTRHAIQPPFEMSPARVASELERLVDAGMQRFHVGHGGPIDAREVLRHARRLRDLRPGPAHVQRLAPAPADAQAHERGR